MPDIDVYPQNFAVVQDAQGVVYIGNEGGVLEYDGEVWRLIALPHAEIVRSLAVAADGRVYVGSYNAFGYLERDAGGKNVFVDLTEKFRQYIGTREFADIWGTLVTPEGVYFRGLRDVFLWNPADGSTAYWHHAQRFGGVLRHNGKTLLQFRGEGLKEREDGGWRLLEVTKSLTTMVHVWVPLADGALLGITTDGHFWRVSDTSVTAATLPPGVPGAETISRGMQLADGSVVLGTADGWVYLLAADLRTQRRFKMDAGYVSGLYPARDGGLLVVTDLALYHVRWLHDWTVLGSQQGADGSFAGLVEWAGDHYLLSGIGVHRLRTDPTGIHFERMPWTKQSVTDMIGMDGSRVMLAGSYHLLLVEGGVARKVSPELIYPRKFLRSRFDPRRILVGTEHGLRVVTPSKDGLHLSAPLPGLDGVGIVTLVERHENEVWAGTERHGVWRFRLTEAGEIAEARRFTQSDGLPVAMPSEAKLTTLADGSLIASTRKGFFRLEGEHFVSTDPDTLSARRAPDELLTLVPTPHGGLWAVSATRVLQRIRADTWQVHDVRLLRVGAIENTYVGADGAMAFTSTHALLLHQPASVVTTAPAPVVALRAVTQKLGAGADVSLPLRPKEPIRLHEGSFGLQFDFSLPEVVRPGVQSYQGRLVGAQDSFSEWSSQHRYHYSSLKPGAYALEVRARDSQGRVSEIEPYRFEVLPAWHATTGARMVIATLCVAVAWGLMLLAARHRTRRLEHANATLENKVAARTSELADANRRLETMVHVDGLTGVSNRRRLDEYLPVVWQLCREQERPLSILLLDVDHFKQYNDTHGHLAGDQLLQQIAQRLQHGLRRTEDLLARYGGEEFLVMLPGADAEVAHATGESMRAAVAESELGVTISIGTCSRVPDGVGSPQAMVADADAALYRAKREGRNRVCASTQGA